MTKERELDASIAEEVFGWQRLSADEAYNWTMSQIAPPPEGMAHRAIAWIFEGDMKACEQCGTLPQFSTDPADSKLLREKLAEQGWEWAFVYSNEPPLFSFGVTRQRTEIIEQADTEERAVALVARRTVEGHLEREVRPC